MKIRFLIHPVISLVIAICFAGCDRYRLDDHVGPAICPSGKFTYTKPFEVNQSEVNFAVGEVAIITASFNEVVSWEMEIQGLTSGAVKRYNGRSSDVLVEWKGKSDEYSPFFQNEYCEVKLTLACLNPVTTSVKVAPNNFMNVGRLLSDFDGSGTVTFSTPPYGLYRDASQSGIKNAPVASSPQGGNYYRIVGQADSAVWFFGGTWCNLNFSSLSVKDPSKVYFNVFLNSNGKKNSIMSFTFVESGAQKNYNVIVDWEGWKMHSFKLSDAGVTSVNDVKQVDIGLGSAPDKGTSGEINFDFLIITENTPFYE
ncbi:MAG: hypothetical protein ACK40G_13990 [Cytophagaceae bacterium]